MLYYYPSFNHIFDELKSLSGNRTGILNQSQVPVCNHPHDVYLKSITGQMPDYHKQFIGELSQVSYHIIGYGSYYEEALIKYLGESIERYATVIAGDLLSDRIVYASYNELKLLHKVMPLEYLQVFTQEQIALSCDLQMMMCDKMVTENDVLGWVKCPMFFEDAEMYVPAQMLCVGYKTNETVGERRIIPGFSTGTASHKTLEAAMCNSLIEYIQIDSMMLSWYTKKPCPKIIVDDPDIEVILEEARLGKDSLYDIIPIDMTVGEDNPLYTFGIILKNKYDEGPYLLFGVQAGLDPKHALLRGIMEASAISYSYYYNLLYQKASLANIECEEPLFLDLDSNVFYYAHPKDQDHKWKAFEPLISGEVLLSDLEDHSGKDKKEDLKNLLAYAKKVSPNAVFLDITPPEALEKGWYVTRVLMPELLEMCIPAFPFANHPRMRQFGGVTNAFVHPMP
ncbi:TPA: YcaO-like family protein [Streptococcus pyogenes]|uniref:YcaO-like family protein n=1 Tax=Streptococcus pyogenes TaxID=1314 RepID=UPI00109C2F63|nr:YcaO-like family protein [Streptococcus pyogenes]QQA63749.1 YcaO-like family protein [Streptococcus pyogenes]VHE76003.1 bacteriocin biosynthesis docking scaffold, SagD family domain-containing protein [Streptococcus pyogenes]VHF07975.1 bacteriocin biosynthesis docking scaffold, SagD family domain-containing protein [Streptococcus pyogenes]VHM42499.1 bacteriocin biosynthesis docking scaffold, SagD family domain-containing protein [Streptococcus pyogenes]HEQ4679994.1 YcaO-like family protein 